MTGKSLKYRILLGVMKVLPVKQIMASPPEKTQKLFRKAYRGVKIPSIEDPSLVITEQKVCGQPVLWVCHKQPSAYAGIYLVGGGMLKYPRPAQVKEVVRLAKISGRDICLPYYPLVFSGAILTDVYAMLYELYQMTLQKYQADHICLMGGSSGGNLALGLVSYINEKGEDLPLPGKIYAGSPGTLLLSEEEFRLAEQLEKTDVIMSVRATEHIWEGMTSGREVPAYMKYLQLGNYAGLKNVYMSFGGEEVFLAGAKSIEKRLMEFGTDVTVEVGAGLYHSYAMMPVVKEAQEGYRNFLDYISV